MPDPAYGPHEGLVAPARPTKAIWRLLVGLTIVAIVVLGLNWLLYSTIRQLAPDYWRDGLVFATAQGDAPLSLLILLGSFGFPIVGVAVAVRMMQNRAPLAVVGPLPLAVRQFWRVMRILLVLGVVILVLPPWDMGDPLVANLGFSRWLVLLPLSLTAVLIQTGAEEYLFRGYVQQSLAARFSSPLVWMVLPSALFALGHYLPQEAGENAGLIALWAFVFGCLAADLTARAGTLGPAIALHMFNNITALLVVAMPGALSGLALFLVPFDLSETDPVRAWLAVDFAMMLVTWLAARLAIRR
ncbi:MAG: CPBP family intramembrane metalloprotease domain-containing protein [Rhodobacteraceae bacterium]|nr:MAG: CPBP family intramembrane metalloprotease domain-containing protein [Paracoccaceae bacterium]